MQLQIFKQIKFILLKQNPIALKFPKTNLLKSISIEIEFIYKNFIESRLNIVCNT